MANIDTIAKIIGRTLSSKDLTDLSAALVALANTSQLLDEDNFASDSATKAPSQQSTKAYIATEVAKPIQAKSGSITDGTPTDAELDTAIGETPATATGKLYVVTDTDGTSLQYLVTSNGTSWFFTPGLTAAT